MAQAQSGMVIVGAGECGARAALALREEGYAGPVTLIGEESHVPYERPPLSKDGLTGEGGGTPKHVTGHKRLDGVDIDFMRAASAVRLDRAAKRVELDGSRSIPYDKLLLATGATPRRLPMADGVSGCVYLRTFDDAVAIRAHLRAGLHVAIIGGGFIGLELAASARQLGCRVTVLEAQPRILMRGVPDDVAAVIHAAHAQHGVDIRCGATITSIGEDAAGVRIGLKDGEIVARLVVIGIGVIPNTSLASTCGLLIDNGIAVDERLFTADPDILAAGDCCSFPLHLYGGRRVRLEAWRNAQEQGSLAARNMLGAGEAYASVPWFWSDQYDLGLQIAGLSDEGATSVRRDLDSETFVLFHLATDGRLVAASGIGPETSVAREIRLAEMLIAKRASPPAEKLAQADVKLKALLAA